jgi:uncharacterized coiled-coil protein SlyX
MGIIKTAGSVLALVGFLVFFILWLLASEDLDKATLDVNRLNQNLAEQDGKIKNLNDSLNSSSLNFKKLQASLNDSNQKVNDQEREINRFKQYNSDLLASLNHAEEENAKLLSDQAATVELPAAADEVGECGANPNAEVDALVKDKMVALEELAKMGAALAVITKERNDLREQLKASPPTSSPPAYLNQPSVNTPNTLL